METACTRGMRMDGDRDSTPGLYVVRDTPGEVASAERTRQVAQKPREDALQQVLGDLQTPVALLELSLGFLSGSLADVPADARSALCDAMRASRRIQQYIDHFVVGEVSGPAALRMFQRQVHLGSVLENLIREFGPAAAAAGKALEFESCGAPVAVRADETLVERAFQALLESALAYARSGQRIAFTIRSGSVAEIELRVDGDALTPSATALYPEIAETSSFLQSLRRGEAAVQRLSGVMSVEVQSTTRLRIAVQLPAATL